jgi:hypothetical protein
MPLRPRVAVLLNASAGMLETQRSDILREALAVTFEQHGISAALEFLAGPELHATAQHAAQGFRDQELDAIVVGAETAASHRRLCDGRDGYPAGYPAARHAEPLRQGSRHSHHDP